MKGVSELISSVLILVVTISIAVIVFSFYTSTVRDTTVGVSNKSTEAVDCASASLNIEDIFITNGTAGTIRAIVRNSGFTDLSINSAEAYNRTGYNFSSSAVLPLQLKKGSVVTLAFGNVSVKNCPNDFSRLVVTTSCGGVSDTFDGTPACT